MVMTVIGKPDLSSVLYTGSRSQCIGYLESFVHPHVSLVSSLSLLQALGLFPSVFSCFLNNPKNSVKLVVGTLATLNAFGFLR